MNGYGFLAQDTMGRASPSAKRSGLLSFHYVLACRQLDLGHVQVTSSEIGFHRESVSYSLHLSTSEARPKLSRFPQPVGFLTSLFLTGIALPSTSISLLERLRIPGQREAWERFVELYSPLLFHWARIARLQEADAADLVQDVFAVLVKKLPAFDYDATKGFRRWLRTVALNKLRDALRRRAAHPAEAAEPLISEPEAPSGDDPFWEVEHRQLLTRRLLEVMRTEFEPGTWRAFFATAIEGRPAAEVGQELNLTAGAVRAAKFRVLTRLRTELDGLLD